MKEIQLNRRQFLKVSGLGMLGLAGISCKPAVTSPSPIKVDAAGITPVAESTVVPSQQLNAESFSTESAPKATIVVAESTVVKKDLTPVAVASAEPTQVAERALIVPAEKVGGDRWRLLHPDQDHKVEIALPNGFTPDKNLHIATDISALELGSDFSIYQDWETALNTKREKGALAGYNYDYNDFCQSRDFQCNVQADMYGWRTFQGEWVEVPLIGRLVGGPRRSVVLNVLNLDGSVHAWDAEKSEQTKVKRGFTATGRIFDGEHNVDILERNLSGHWTFRQFSGTPEKSYIGITDSPDNAQEVLLVSVQRKQWGFNADKSKRLEFQLIRAEIVRRGGAPVPTRVPVPEPTASSVK